MKITAIQRFSTKDGYGIRTTVFLKGCPLRCRWCHNPETQEAKQELMFAPQLCIGCGKCLTVCPRGVHGVGEDGEHTVDRRRCVACGKCRDECPGGALTLSGEEMSVEKLFAEVEKDRAFFGDKGGVTLSGGEPMMQGEDAVLLLQKCKAAGISTALETCGQFEPRYIPALLQSCDLFLYDVKLTDDRLHRAYTGVSNRLILENLRRIAAGGGKIRLRCILLHGLNTNPAHYAAVAEIAGTIPNLDGVEFLPYHTYGGAKALQLGREDPSEESLIPTEEEIAAAKDCFPGIRTEF